MKAAYIESFAPQGNIKIGQVPTPKPGDGEVCIAISYAGVNPADAKIAQGLFRSRIAHQFPLILGWEASGIIHSLGQHTTSLKVGDKVYVYCRKPILQWGSWAQYLVFPEEHVVLMPKNLSMAEAAAIPLAGLTAWQALFEKINLKPGEQILIHGGGGGVGGFAIQWAKIYGAQVITTATLSKFDYIKKLGADEVIDYQKASFVDQIRKFHPSGVDAVFDTIGGSVYEKSFEVLKPGGRIVSLLSQPDANLAARFKVKADYLFVHPNGKQLQEIAKLFELGKAKPPHIRELPLDQASQAIEEIKQGHTIGKIVIKIGVS
jgi:NADPH:quinone reductase-like Zn-dependent oxidoreductase